MLLLVLMCREKLQREIPHNHFVHSLSMIKKLLLYTLRVCNNNLYDT